MAKSAKKICNVDVLMEHQYQNGSVLVLTSSKCRQKTFLPRKHSRVEAPLGRAQGGVSHQLAFEPLVSGVVSLGGQRRSLRKL
eukprot:3795660-Amphidinium_carterae.1